MSEEDDDLLPYRLSDLLRRKQPALTHAPPLANPALLPVHELDPEVFERLIAEMVSRQPNQSAVFYGRRGQKQYGLDVVEFLQDGSRALYQVKRYQELSPALIEAAVGDYAGPPRAADADDPPRRFDPRSFTVVTSAQFDTDTANIDCLAALQERYRGDLQLAVWGAEAISRRLRDAHGLVHAYFGPAWAQAYCGFAPTGTGGASPPALAFVEGPLAVLGLETFEADARNLESSDPVAAAGLLGKIAEELSVGGFPSHADEMRRRQADVYVKANAYSDAFGVLYSLALDRAVKGTGRLYDGILDDLVVLRNHVDPAQGSRIEILVHLKNWYEHGLALNSIVEQLQVVAGAGHADDLAVLACLAIEQAIVDGYYDFEPPRLRFGVATPGDAESLTALRDLARSVDTPDPVIRARLACAVADSQLPLGRAVSEVDALFAPLLEEASAGRFRTARCLVQARVARALAAQGELRRAVNLLRQATLSRLEDHYYGDARESLLAGHNLAREFGEFRAGLDAYSSALPGDEKLLAAPVDPFRRALATIVDSKNLSNALSDLRRHLWECRIAGHLIGEIQANLLLGRVLEAGGRATAALEAFIAAGARDEAFRLAGLLGRPPEVGAWMLQPVRRSQSAAVAVLKATAATTPDSEVERTVSYLCGCAASLWSRNPGLAPRPELEALVAIGAFGKRIPLSAIDPLLALLGGDVVVPPAHVDELGLVLVQAYWAVPGRRADIAAALRAMLGNEHGNERLWSLLDGLPGDARAPLCQALLRQLV